MADPLCLDGCGRPVADGWVRAECMARTGKRLAEIAQLAPEARAVAAGQTSRGDSGAGGKPGSMPPLNFDILERLDEITNDLQGWVRVIEEERGPDAVSAAIGGRTLPDPLAHAATALGGQLEWLRHRVFADEAMTSIAEAARKVAGIINGPAPGRYAGPCSALVDDPAAPCPVNCACHNGPHYACDEPGGCGSAGCGRRTCGQDVTARPGSTIGTCRACGAEYDVDEQQAWMRGEIEGYLARPVEIAGMLLTLGLKVTYRRIMKFVEKGQLIARGHDEDEQPLFRVGDVLDIVRRNENAQRPGGRPATQSARVVA